MNVSVSVEDDSGLCQFAILHFNFDIEIFQIMSLIAFAKCLYLYIMIHSQFNHNPYEIILLASYFKNALLS